MPRSVTAISPTESEAGGKTCATLGAAKVTVRSASTWGPIGCASLPERPLGRSTATQGIGRSLIASTASANSPSSGRVRPVPKRASTTRSHSAAASAAPARSAGAATSITASSALRQIASWVAASPASWRPPVTRKIRTSQPRTERWRATARPSPPLLPGPQKIAADSASPNDSPIASTTPMAAFSISTRLGIPSSSMAARSTSRMASAVRILMQPPLRFWILDFGFAIGEGRER